MTYLTQYEAVLAAIDEVRRDGGGTVWICRAACATASDGECDCDPSGIEVPATQ